MKISRFKRFVPIFMIGTSSQIDLSSKKRGKNKLRKNKRI